MRQAIVCFSGKIASGKSSISTAVAEALEYKRASFGEYVRHCVSKAGGDPDSRQALQDFGQIKIEKDVQKFCRDLLRYADCTTSDSIVVDGIRHVEAFDAIRELFPKVHVMLLYLDADEAARRLRREQRGDDSNDFARASGHPVERDLDDVLPSRADAVIDANLPFADGVQHCLSAITQFYSENA